jgi:hypothetical protein
VLMLLSKAVWNSVVSVTTENRPFLHFSTWRSLLVLWTCFHVTITAPTVDPGQLYLTNLLDGKVASYDGATLKVTELYSKAHSTADVCLWRLHSCLLDFIHLWWLKLTTNLKGCPHTFVCTV